MHLEILPFESPLGLFARASDKLCVTGYGKLYSDVLGAPMIETTLANIRAIGIFLAMNSSGAVVPKIVEKEEAEKLRNAGLNIIVLDSKETAMGNLILANDKGCLISRSLAPHRKRIEDCLGCEAVEGTIASLDLVGSCALATNKGFLAHRDCSEPELKRLEDVLRVKGDIGTANFGSPFVGASVIANSKGFIVSEATTGPEIARIDEALGFL